MTDSLKFGFIVLCFIIALVSYFFCHSKKDWRYLATAMGFTAVSDYYLVLVNIHRIGLFTFCFVHMIYILRVSENKKKSIQRILITVLAGVLLYVLFFDIVLIPIAIVYAALFVQNLAAHIKYYRNGEALPGINRGIMLIGLILFALCDINVLMFNLPRFIEFPQELANLGHRLIWFFYGPSQLLLGVSAWRFGARRRPL